MQRCRRIQSGKVGQFRTAIRFQTGIESPLLVWVYTTAYQGIRTAWEK